MKTVPTVALWNPKARWFIIVAGFILIATLDFSTSSEFVLAYLYIIPILISISFLKPRLAKVLVGIAIFATLLNLIFPHNMLSVPSILVNRSLAGLAILISAFFMVRYIRYQARIQEQEQLLATERQLAHIREDFMATLTHDLKTPLLGGQQTLQHLREGAFGSLSDEQQNIIEALQRSNTRQLDLVEALVASCKIDNLGAELTYSAVDMDSLVADILTEVQFLASDRQITLNYVCKRTPSLLQGDPLQLKRVLANLIHNALNYTPSNGVIEIEVKEQPAQLMVTVSDTGPGINPEEREKIFTRFYRSGEQRQVVGTGLGLYLSRQIIVAHRGRIWVENLSPSGCKFTFTLPRSAEQLQENDHG